MSSRRQFLQSLTGTAVWLATGENQVVSQTMVSGDSAASPSAPAVTLFPLSDSPLLDGEFKRHQEVNRAYLRSLDPDRLLSWCRIEAGLEPKAPPYGGWESGDSPRGTQLPGHILGFYLSAASMTCQACGDEVLRRNIAYTIAELAEVQRTNGNGYLLPTVNGKRIFREVAAGRIDITNSGFYINGSFEPTYVLNKIMLGLYAAFSLADCAQARHVLVAAADWFGQDVLNRLSDEQVQTLLDCEHGSLHESFAEVYELTGDPRHLNWARRLCHRRILEPLAEGIDELTSLHANMQIPKATGFQRISTLNGEEALARAAAFFWSTVVGNRSWVNGGNSTDEHFNDPHAFADAMWEESGPESCNSVNMLRLTEALYCSGGSVDMVDYYERTLFNHILPAHEPEKGAFVYFTPMRPGHYRVYSDDHASMWCCAGTGMESPAKYARMIYARDAQGIFVNLFIASQLRYAERGVTITQETRFPNEPCSRLRFACKRDVEFTLRIRHPKWVRPGELRISVNGRPEPWLSQPGSYVPITRQWKDGDSVEIVAPMHLRLENLPNDGRYAAVLYGPILLAGAIGRVDLTKEECWAKADFRARRTLPDHAVPVFARNREEVLSHIERIPGERLAFRTVGLAQPFDLELRPLTDLHFSRYVVYWRLLAPSEWEVERARRDGIARREAELNARTVDRLIVGEPHCERSHRLRPGDTMLGTGPAPGYRVWRELADGGSFRCELAIDPGASMALHCECGVAKDGAWGLEIVAAGRTLVRLTDEMRAGAERVVTVPLGPELAQGKTSINLVFRVPAGAGNGGVFDCRIVRV
jgi:DUF1680 family protein